MVASLVYTTSSATLISYLLHFNLLFNFFHFPIRFATHERGDQPIKQQENDHHPDDVSDTVSGNKRAVAIGTTDGFFLYVLPAIGTLTDSLGTERHIDML